MPNDLETLIPQLLAQGLLTLREACIMPRLVNRSYENIAAQKGDLVDVPLYDDRGEADDVVPSNTPPAPGSSKPGKVQIPLDQWKYKDFYLTDREMLQVQDGHIPRAAAEAVRSCARSVNKYIFSRMKARAYLHAGTAGTTPFLADLDPLQSVRTLLNAANVAAENRRVVLDPFAEGNAVFLDLFAKANERGDQQGIIAGTIGRKFGADWAMDQQVPSHSNGAPGAGPFAAKGAQTAANAKGVYTDGSGSLIVDGITATTGTIKSGTLFSIAGDDQQYVVIDDVTADAAGAATLHTMPALAADAADNAVVTLVADHVSNFYFHEQAFAFASRPLADTVLKGLGSIVQSMPDPVSGLVLRLEVSRQHKQTVWCFDILFGGQTTRHEGVSRILG